MNPLFSGYDRREVFMANKRRMKINMDVKLLTERDRMKYEIAEELGLLDKVHEKGWKGLSAKESGKIGGIMTSRMRKKQDKEEE